MESITLSTPGWNFHSMACSLVGVGGAVVDVGVGGVWMTMSKHPDAGRDPSSLGVVSSSKVCLCEHEGQPVKVRARCLLKTGRKGISHCPPAYNH